MEYSAPTLGADFSIKHGLDLSESDLAFLVSSERRGRSAEGSDPLPHMIPIHMFLFLFPLLENPLQNQECPAGCGGAQGYSACSLLCTHLVPGADCVPLAVWELVLGVATMLEAILCCLLLPTPTPTPSFIVLPHPPLAAE